MRPLTARLAMIGVLAALAGCQPIGERPRPMVKVEAPTKADAWMQIASQADQQRLANLTGAWAAGLGEARRNFASAIRDEGLLLKQDAALPRPQLTPGSYQCRMVSLGRAAKGQRALERFKPFFCYVQVERDQLTIVKQTGSQRPAGRLWDDDNPLRLIFLGSLALGSEDEVKAYGDDPKRDMAGVIERIAPFRWRLVIPWPRDGGKLDVIELTPTPNQPQ